MAGSGDNLTSFANIVVIQNPQQAIREAIKTGLNRL